MPNNAAHARGRNPSMSRPGNITGQVFARQQREHEALRAESNLAKHSDAALEAVSDASWRDGFHEGLARAVRLSAEDPGAFAELQGELDA